MKYSHPTNETIQLTFNETIEFKDGRKAQILVNFNRHVFKTDNNNPIFALEYVSIAHLKISFDQNIMPLIHFDFISACNALGINPSVYDFNCNCHGWTFLEGKFRIEKTEFIKTILIDEYDLLPQDETEFSENDVILYFNDIKAKTVKDISDLDPASIVHSCKFLNGKFSHKLGDRTGEKTFDNIMDGYNEYCGKIKTHLLFRKKIQ